MLAFCGLEWLTITHHFGITARLLVMTPSQSVEEKGLAMKPADSCCDM